MMDDPVQPDPKGSSPLDASDRPTDSGRRLYRSRQDRVIAGVCGGLGHYLGVDPVLLRIAFVALVFAGGSGILLYVIGWIAMPEGDDSLEMTARGAPSTSASLIVGGVLILLGLFFLLRIVVPWFDERVVWAAILIGVGLLVLIRGMRR